MKARQEYLIATELGGGGGVDPAITDQTGKGLYSMLRHIGVLTGTATRDDTAKMVTNQSGEHSLFSTGEGIFDRAVSAGASVKAGQLAGRFHCASEPERRSQDVVFQHDGFVLAHTNRGFVQRGDLLMLVVQDLS